MKTLSLGNFHFTETPSGDVEIAVDEPRDWQQPGSGKAVRGILKRDAIRCTLPSDHRQQLAEFLTQEKS